LVDDDFAPMIARASFVGKYDQGGGDARQWGPGQGHRHGQRRERDVVDRKARGATHLAHRACGCGRRGAS
jgi:hypothetical protein